MATASLQPLGENALDNCPGCRELPNTPAPRARDRTEAGRVPRCLELRGGACLSRDTTVASAVVSTPPASHIDGAGGHHLDALLCVL